MKLAVSNIGWDSTLDESMYEYLQKQHFSALEIAPSRIFPNQPYAYCDQAKKFAYTMQQQFNLQICSMQSIWFGKTQRIVESKLSRVTLFNYTQHAVDFAVAVGCPNIVFGCPKNRSISNPMEAKLVEDFLVTVADLASKKSVVIAFEANPTIYQTNFINTNKQAIELVRRLQHPALKINLDIGAMVANNESLDILADNIDIINHVHISEPYLRPLEHRILHRELRTLLEYNGYDKCISLEMVKPDNIRSLYDSIEYLKEVFA